MPRGIYLRTAAHLAHLAKINPLQEGHTIGRRFKKGNSVGLKFRFKKGNPFAFKKGHIACWKHGLNNHPLFSTWRQMIYR
jgi:hypothetical protein